MSGSIVSLQQGLIDYAGIFPPSKLPLEQALQNYIRYQGEEERWKLNSFIVSFNELVNLLKLLENIEQVPKIDLTVTLPKLEADVFTARIEELEQVVQKVMQQLPKQVQIVGLEVAIPNTSKPTLHRVAQLSTTLSIQLFCEISILTQSEEVIIANIEDIQLFNKKRKQLASLALKLRTGGVTEDLFPTPSNLAHAIAQSAKHQLMIKYTAGLHHPIRMYRDEVKTNMYGFVNVVAATLYAYEFKLTAHEIKKILIEEDASAFQITETSIQWQSYCLQSEKIEQLRQAFKVCFGSCSFDEPKSEFKLLFEKGGVKV
jgi:hypothetical protein